jgi:release factor glutamine methyltransferase
MRLLELINRTAREFGAGGGATPRLDAEVLLAHCLGKDRLYLYTNADKRLPEADVQRFLQFASRRRQGEPVAYILGRKEFWSAVFEVNRRVLIPRPETEILVEECLKVQAAMNAGDARILELGTGSGAIAVTLAEELKNASLVATDISPEAVAVAQRNARRCGVENRVAFLAGNLFAPLSGKFDMIVSNPPYISEAEYEDLPEDVRLFEPALALKAGPDGMAFHREIIFQSDGYLKAGGWLMLEIGSGQKEGIETLFHRAGSFDEARFRRDYAGWNRVAAARKKLHSHG